MKPLVTNLEIVCFLFPSLVNVNQNRKVFSMAAADLDNGTLY